MTMDRTETLRISGTARAANVDQFVALFTYSALPFFARTLEEAWSGGGDLAAGRRKRGRRMEYSTACLLATLACARVTGSVPSALTELASANGLVWERIRQAFYDVHDEQLPATPPNRDHLRYLIRQITDHRQLGDGPLQALKEAFTVAALRQARWHGNLHPGVTPDWAVYDPRHTVFGDGTILRRFSDVTWADRSATERVAVGSRARDPQHARVQTEVRSGASDHRGVTGINFVALHTRTPDGLVTLALQSTLGSEQWATIEACERLIDAAGDGMHTLVYDRVVTGWLVRHLMGRHRIQTLGKITATGSKTAADQDDEHQVVTGPFTHHPVHLPERIQALAAARGITVGKLNEPVLRRDVLQEIYDGDRPSPVGTTLYPTSKGFDLVHGYTFALSTDHLDTHGARCTHDLVVDDGALYTYELDELDARLVKTSHLPCTSATPHFDPATGGWTRGSTYHVSCGDTTFPYTYLWEPEPTRYTPEHTGPKKTADPIGWRLHPIPRADTERFAAVARDRNDSESYNSRLQRTLPGLRRDRAASLRLANQELDVLLGSVLGNALTWATRTN